MMQNLGMAILLSNIKTYVNWKVISATRMMAMIASTIGMKTLTLRMLFQMTDFQDGIPIGEYEDLSYQCHLPDDYDCQHGMDEDFQNGIPISEYEKVCEVVPDDYNCDMDEGVDCCQ